MVKDIKFGLNDVFIAPASVSEINSRSECDIYNHDGVLPLFTAPMSGVVDLNNYKLFQENKITPILPRSVNFIERLNLCHKNWCAFSLSEFEDVFNDASQKLTVKNYVLIDIANGNMLKLHNTIKKGKEIHGEKLVIMAGNVGNPETYRILSNAGVQYVRCGIGGGNMCITSSNTSIHYPYGSLISECFEISQELKNPAYIIADGGMKNYSDIIKAISLGADYVMVGSLFAKMLESAGQTHRITDNYIYEVDQYSEHIKNSFKNGARFQKSFYGMASKKAQKELGNETIKTAEGIEKTLDVEYTMSQWVENFSDYLRSAMSYTNRRYISDFIGNVQVINVTHSASNSINK